MMRLVHEFKVTHRAIECSLGVFLKDRVRNEIIRERTEVNDMIRKIRAGSTIL